MQRFHDSHLEKRLLHFNKVTNSHKVLNDLADTIEMFMVGFFSGSLTLLST